MNTQIRFAYWASLPLLSLFACGTMYPTGGDGIGPAPSAGGGPAAPAPTAGGTTGGGAGDQAFLRVAHLSGDAGALDVCVRTTGTMGWPDGLAFKALQQPIGISYPAVTNYLQVPAGAPIDIRAAAAGTDCTPTNKLVDAANVGPFLAGKYYTVAAVGLKAGAGAQALALQVFKDDTAIDSAHVKMRFIHAAPGIAGAVDVLAEHRQNDADPAAVLFAAVGLGQIANPTLPANAMLTAKGYALVPTAPGPLGVRVDQGGTPAVIDALFVSAPPMQVGAVYTLFAIGTAAPRAFVCSDLPTPIDAAFLASCAKL